jgi:hypothetical protein
MKIAFRSLFCFLLAFTSHIAFAQNRVPVGQALDFWISNAEREVVSAADAMPEEKYFFAPTAGQFAGVRTFAQQVKHLAANNYRMAARIVGQTPTPDQDTETGPETVQSKGQIMDYAKGSFTALHSAAATITAENGFMPVLSTRVGTTMQNYPGSVCDRCGRPFLRSLRPNGGISAHERSCSTCQSKMRRSSGQKLATQQSAWGWVATFATAGGVVGC